MRLSAPALVVFLIPIIITALVVAVQYFGVAIPYVSDNAFEAMLIAYVLLLIGNLFSGL
jgi:hypothetical protein